MKLDTRYLSVHPATQVWFERRERCNTCAHLLIVEPSHWRRQHGERIMRCTAAEDPRAMVRTAGRARGTRHDWLHCIDASADGGPCGADAVLFKRSDHHGN